MGDVHDMLSGFRIPPKEQPQKWQKSKDGRWVMPELQSEFLDWLLTPRADRDHNTQKAWAEAHGVAPATPGDWKTDRRFRREWEDRANARNIGVERMQNVLDTLYEAAVDGDVSAAKLYITEIEKMRPPREVVEDRETETMSDEDLEAELRGLLDSVEEAISTDEGSSEAAPQ